MPRLRTIMVLFGSILLASAWSHPAFAQLTRLNVGYSAISGDQLPAWVAKEAGIFREEWFGCPTDLFYRRHDGSHGSGIRRHAYEPGRRSGGR